MQQKTTTTNVNANVHERLAYSVDEAARLIGVGRTFLYAAIKQGTLKSSKVGGRRLLTVKAIETWLEINQESQIAEVTDI